MSVLGFAQDAQGELYVLANDTGTPFENTGVVLRISPVWVELTAKKGFSADRSREICELRPDGSET